MVYLHGGGTVRGQVVCAERPLRVDNEGVLLARGDGRGQVAAAGGAAEQTGPLVLRRLEAITYYSYNPTQRAGFNHNMS